MGSGHEDLLVCNEGDNSLSIIDVASREVRRTVTSMLDRPFEVAITQRQANFGFFRNVYFAYILNRSGTVAMFESGPTGVDGWGFDDVIGTLPGLEFKNPKAIQADPSSLFATVWVAHEGPIDPVDNSAGPEGVGAVTSVSIESANFGQMPLGNSQEPRFRDLSIGVLASLGEEALSGIPTDIAFDNQRSFGALPNVFTPFSAGEPIELNGKSQVRVSQVGIVNSHESRFLFAAIPNPVDSDGVVDVIDIERPGLPRLDVDVFTPGVQSVPAPRASVVVDYWRQ